MPGILQAADCQDRSALIQTAIGKFSNRQRGSHVWWEAVCIQHLKGRKVWIIWILQENDSLLASSPGNWFHTNVWKEDFSPGALHGCRHLQLFSLQLPPTEDLLAEKSCIGCWCPRHHRASSVPWSFTNENKEFIVFRHVVFKMLNPKICLEDIWRSMPYSLSPSLPVMQVDLCGVDFLTSTFCGASFSFWNIWDGISGVAMQAAGKTHSSGRSSCGKQDWIIFTGVSSEYVCFQTNKIRSRR